MKMTNTTQTLWHTTVASLLLTAAASHAQNPVAFQVDMTVAPANTATTVIAKGSFDGWGAGLALTNNGSGIYSGTFDVAGTPGTTVVDYKFYYDPGANWESPASTCGNNRTFTLAGGAQTLPLVYFNDAPPVLPDNNVTLQVDMTAQVATGAFTNGSSTITVAGGFTGWGDGTALTNNPALPGSGSNVYKMVINIPGVVGACQSYKFRSNGGWESPASTGGNNRTFQIAGGDQVLPLVYYNDASPCDLLQAGTQVTFVLKLTNGTPSADGGIIFDRSVNNVYINGEFLGWWAWYDGISGGNGPANQMTNNPVGSDFFQQTFTIPAGKTLSQTYKYSMDGLDNEAGFAVNHVRYVRSLSGVPYTMPTDRFGTNQGPPLVEASFGSLAIGAPSGGTVPITWSGRQCVTLQASSVLTNGVNLFWTDIGATEGTSSTNFPVQAGPRYFRLLKKP